VKVKPTFFNCGPCYVYAGVKCRALFALSTLSLGARHCRAPGFFWKCTRVDLEAEAEPWDHGVIDNTCIDLRNIRIVQPFDHERFDAPVACASGVLLVGLLEEVCARDASQVCDVQGASFFPSVPKHHSTGAPSSSRINAPRTAEASLVLVGLPLTGVRAVMPRRCATCKAASFFPSVPKHHGTGAASSSRINAPRTAEASLVLVVGSH
jgi:hypothetical protein